MAPATGVSLAGRAYLAVREEILRGQLRPGTALSRRRLARDLGMSVVPVSDALRRLEDDGLVESRPRAGTRVRVPTERDIRELYELREALESQSARLFAGRRRTSAWLQRSPSRWTRSSAGWRRAATSCLLPSTAATSSPAAHRGTRAAASCGR
jgi:DNA-binding GntR family transcriptional regulator